MYKTGDYTDELPSGYRWADEVEAELWRTLPHFIYIYSDGDQVDIAVPV